MVRGKWMVVTAGAVLACVGLALPLIGMERLADDARPIVAGLALLAAAAGCFVSVWRPCALEGYVKVASLAFFVLMLLSLAGLLSEMDAGSAGMGAMWLGGR